MKIALLSVMLFSFDNTSAQVVKDTLKEIQVKAKKKRNISADERLNTFSPGQKITTIDSITLEQYKFQSVANLLSQQTSVFVKSYGFNGLATLNFRGASAAQSQVYWNGVPLQNAALGIADVSLLPVALMNKVNIVYGSSAALWGSGNVGGALVVENERPYFDTAGSSEHSLSGVAGSFSQYRLGVKSSFSSSKWFFSANAFGQNAANNFPYEKNARETVMSNAQMQSGTGLLQAAYKIDGNNIISFHGWYQQYYREIPPALFEPYSVKNQRDESLRFLLNWKRSTGKAAIYAKTSFVSDRMLYKDTVISLRSDNVTNQTYAEPGLKYNINYHHKLLLFVPIQIAWISRQTTGDMFHQNRYGVAAAWAMQYFREKLDISVNARAERINDRSIFLPGINAAYALTGWLSFRVNVQKSYRAPTLNELYYVPGGNDKLKPEEGWNGDAGYTLKTGSHRRVSFIQDVSVFNRVIDNWILWFGGAIWTPHNIALVHSRGMETENKLNWNLNNIKLHLGINTSYVLATTQQSYLPGDGSIGKQIPYSPRYSAQGNTGFSYKGWYVNYNHVYTGYRFITTDESQYLEPYTTGNIQFLYTARIRSYSLQVNAQVNNIWNADYAVVNARPMPLLNWLLGIRLGFARK